MSLLADIKNAFSGDDSDKRDLTFDIGEDEFDFTLSDKKDIKLTSKIDKLSDVDVKYPLIKPFAYAHVKWDEDEKAIIYRVIEPELEEEDEQTLNMIKENLSEKIDVSLSAMKGREKIISYIEGKLNDILLELGLNLTDEQHDKILYYLYRDFVGLGKTEPFMHDPYIEDLGCDGTNTPLFAVHSEFGSVKTNVVYNDHDELENLVIKLAERCGRYVSYANPLLDGALPDGSRVNASLTEDVTSNGPTFSIRKFQDTPFSAIDIMDLGTASADIMAYLWICQQYQQSILIAGGTATGKTSFLNAAISFIPPEDKIVSIEDSVTGDTEIEIEFNGIRGRETISDLIDPLIEKKGIKTADGAEKINLEKSGIKVPTINSDKELEMLEPSAAFRHKVDKDIYRVKTSTGKEVKVTEDHSIFGLKNSKITEIKPKNLSIGDFIATPRKLKPGDGIDSLDILKLVRDKERIFAEGDLEKVFELAPYTEIKQTSNISESGYNHWKRNGMMRAKELHHTMEQEELKLDDDKVVLRSKSKQTKFPLKLDVTEEMLEVFGLWLGDGSFDYNNENTVMITTSEDCIEQKVRDFADQLGINISKKPDGTLSINSVLLYELMRGIGFEGKSETKRIPGFCRNLDEGQICSFLRGYFSADGCVKPHEASCSSKNRELLKDIQELLLKLGIVSSINDYEREDGCTELTISSQKFVDRFKKQVGFIQERKLEKIVNRDAAHHEKTDIIPTDEELAQKVHSESKIQWNYRNGVNNLGRSYLQEIAEKSENEELTDLANSDIFWDKVEEVEKIDTKETYVYDFSVPGPERFIAEKILLHNTRELQLPHENWIPSVTREMFGTGQNGDVDMDDLLKESFRQNPDYVVVGEVRGEEASVLFQGMSSGHPSMGTIHASSPNAVVKRLVTPPISLSAALIEAIDVMVLMTHAKGVEKSARRVKSIHELQKVVGESASARTNEAFTWTAMDDSFNQRGEPYLFDQISNDYGISKKNLQKELEQRTQVLEWLQDKDVKNFDKVSEVIAEYYKNKEEILKMVNSENDEYTLEDVIQAESKVDLSHPDQLDSAMKREDAENVEQLESEIQQIESEANQNLDSNTPIEQKKATDENPVAELEKRLKSEEDKIDSIRSRSRDEKKQNPFEESDQKVEENPFEA